MHVQGLRKRRDNSVEEPAINLTALIDVVFVILIMFILIAPLLELEQVELADAPTSKQRTVEVKGQSPIAIYVKNDNTIWYQNQSVSTKQLAARLATARRSHPDAIPQLYHDRKAQFGTYQSVKNTVEAAGFEKMDLILNPGS